MTDNDPKGRECVFRLIAYYLPKPGGTIPLLKTQCPGEACAQYNKFQLKCGITH